MTSRQAGRWIIPKGWPIKRLKPHLVASREAFEEAGLVGRAAKKPIARYTYATRLKRRVIDCRVDVFPLEVAELLERWPEGAERERRWFSLGEAALRVEKDLASILNSFGRVPPSAEEEQASKRGKKGRQESGNAFVLNSRRREW